MNKKLLLYLGFLFFINKLTAQNQLQVLFYVNDKKIDIQNNLVTFSKTDVLKIELKYYQNFNVEAVRVKAYTLVPVKNTTRKDDQQQSQTMAKMKLAVGTEKTIEVKFKNVKNPLIQIPISSLYVSDLSKLRINIMGCTDQAGSKIHRNNKSYEIFMPIYSQLKAAKLVVKKKIEPLIKAFT